MMSRHTPRHLALALTALLAAPAGHSVAGEAPAASAVTDTSFKCVTKMTKVRGFYVDNLLGHLDQTLAVANSPTGGTYPPGSVLQLVPTEVMVKQAQGTNAATHDWEFFELDVSPNGTKIRKRGYTDVVNRFGGNCFGCHVAAKPEWDLVCEESHGCAPIPITPAMFSALHTSDPRCVPPNPLTQADKDALAALDALLKPKQEAVPAAPAPAVNN